MAVVGDVVSGAFSILSGLQRKEEMKAQAMAAEYNAGIERIRGMQGAADVRADLNETIAAINTLQAARGGDMDSATSRLIRQDRRRTARDTENSVKLGSKLNELNLKEQARGLRRGAPWAAAQGFVQGVSDFTQAAERAFGGGSGGE